MTESLVRTETRDRLGIITFDRPDALNALNSQLMADLMRVWGFTYKSQFVWEKPSPGVGAYWRMAHELLLIGVQPDSWSSSAATRSRA